MQGRSCFRFFIFLHMLYITYTEWVILFLYKTVPPSSLPWIISVNECQFFIHISETMLPKNMNCISLERSFHSLQFCSFCYMKIHSEMAEKSPVKDFWGLFSLLPLYT